MGRFLLGAPFVRMSQIAAMIAFTELRIALALARSHHCSRLSPFLSLGAPLHRRKDFPPPVLRDKNLCPTKPGPE